MTTIATLAVRLIGDIGRYRSAMSEAIQTSQKTANEIGKNIEKVGKNISNLGQKATTGLTLPLIAAGTYAVGLASDYEETKNKAVVVFGEMADSIVANSERASAALGVSKTEYLNYASSIGAALTAGGMGVAESAGLAEQAVQHFADLASFHNAKAEDVAVAWQSAIRGQYEPIQKYFPFITNEYMKTYGVANGLIDSNTETLTANQRAIILNAIAMNEELNPAVNDFAETSTGLANSTRIMQAQLKDAGITLGQQLLPYVLQGVQWFSQLVTQFQALSPEQQKWILVILGAVAAAGPLLMIAGSLVTTIGALVPVITAVGGALLTLAPYLLIIAAVAALVYFAWTNNWGGIQEKTQAAITFIQGLIAGGMQFINDLTSGKLGVWSQLWNNTLAGIQMWWNLFTTNIKLIFQAFTAAFRGDWYTFGERLRMVWNNMWTGIQMVLQIAWANIKLIFSTAITNVINFFRTTDWGSVGRGIIDGIANGIRNGIELIVNAARSAAQAALQAAQGFLGIHSPSKVFEMQVGMQMAAGTALGWEKGLDTMLQPSFGMLQPATVPMPSVAGMSGGGGVSGPAAGARDNDEVVALLEEIAEKNKIDYEKLARVLRDAMLLGKQ